MPDEFRKPEGITISNKIVFLKIIRNLHFLMLLNKRHENIKMEISNKIKPINSY